MVQAKAKVAAGKRAARDVPDRIGKYVINHSFILPGLIGVLSSCVAGVVEVTWQAIWGVVMRSVR